MIVHERLRDRVEEILPTREDFTLSATELAIWLSCTQEQAQKACRALQRFGAVGIKLQKRRTEKRTNTTRTMWWRAG